MGKFSSFFSKMNEIFWNFKENKIWRSASQNQQNGSLATGSNLPYENTADHRSLVAALMKYC